MMSRMAFGHSKDTIPFRAVAPCIVGQKSSNFGGRTSLPTRPAIIRRGFFVDISFCCALCDTFGFPAESPHKAICKSRSGTMMAARSARPESQLLQCGRSVRAHEQFFCWGSLRNTTTETTQFWSPKLDGADIVCDEKAIIIAFFAIVLHTCFILLAGAPGWFLRRTQGPGRIVKVCWRTLALS
jgi:hypothetical protein